MVPLDTNEASDIFVRDRVTGKTTRVSVNSIGSIQANGSSFDPALSADGRYVAFASTASNLVLGDLNGPNVIIDGNNTEDIYVHDRETGATTLISVDGAGRPGDHASSAPAISADGRYVVFHSHASNLVPNDTNDAADIFVHDRQTSQTTRVSVSGSGVQGNGSSQWPTLSADGRYIAFASAASNLVSGDTNHQEDAFVHDRQTGQTIRVSVNSGQQQANHRSTEPYVNATGRYVAHQSLASNLVPGDTNATWDAFVHDRQTGRTTRLSVTSQGTQGQGPSGQVALSASGRYVAFTSEASNLVPNDTNDTQDIFVHDRQTGTTTRASVNSLGAEATEYSCAGTEREWPLLSLYIVCSKLGSGRHQSAPRCLCA